MSTGTQTAVLQKVARNTDIVLILGIVIIVLMMIIPLPTVLLDLLLTLNITFSLIVLLLALYTTDTLQFSTFPSLLLIATLFRLALNISSTRLILLNGFAGQVIQAFGSFVIGGNAVVGFIIFLILVVIQFIVITRGAERVAEVAARFTLDAMPGKQMSIDADLNAGIITEQEAKERRKNIQREADFYGAMDGASKFVKGDAIASIIITLINVTGGFIIGMLQMGLTAAESLQRFTLLTVGDGLVSQIPALLISTATGLIVTRAASESNLGQDLVSQIFSKPKVLAIAAIVLCGIAFLPGMPTLPFFILALFLGMLSYVMFKTVKNAKEELPALNYEEEIAEMKKPENVMSLLQIEPIEFEFGYGLLPFADPGQGGPLMDRVVMIRRQCALELGIIVPTVRIRDNMQLKPNTYIIKIKGIQVAQFELLLGHYLALDTGEVAEEIYGVETIEPAFGLKAYWITEEQRDAAEMAGYTVVDLPSVVATHLTEVIKRHAHELLGRQEVKKLLDNIQKDYPALIEELVPNVLSIGEIQKVLQNLLKEKVSIRDLVTILECLADYAPTTKDTDILTEYVRQSLARQITLQYTQGQGKLMVISLDNKVENLINESIQRTEHGTYLSMDPHVAGQIMQSLNNEIEKASVRGITPIILCPPVTRIYFRRLTERMAPHLAVLSYNEIDPNIEVQSIGVVRI